MAREPRHIPEHTVRPLLAHDIDWLRGNWPLDLDGWAAGRPVVLEIGFGDGGFLLNMARQRRDVVIVGIEVSWGRLRRVCETAAREGLTHLKTIHGDAHVVLKRAIRPNQFTEVFINHPDPWDKTRHTERRLLQPEFLKLLSSRLVPKGRLEVATDHAELAEWIAGVFAAQSMFQPLPGYEHGARPPERFPTRYEMKARAKDIPIRYFILENAAPVAAPPTSPVEQEMPTIRLHGAVNPDELMRRFTLHTVKEKPLEDEFLLCFQNIYARTSGPAWLVEVLVQEDELRQIIAVEVEAKPDGNLVIHPSSIGFPKYTAGVKRAVWWVARGLLQAANGELTVVNSEFAAAFPLDG